MGWIVLGVVVVFFIILMFIPSTYNEIVRLRNRVDNAWAQIDVQLKRRIDLIPNLVEVTKGYAKHESATLEKVVAARNMAAGAKNVEDSIEANNQLTGALKTLFSVTEAYPELKANTNFTQLQNELKETEDKIMYARQFYNDTVTLYNTKIQMYPGNLVAQKYNFTAKPLFEIAESDRAVPEVKF